MQDVDLIVQQMMLGIRISKRIFLVASLCFLFAEPFVFGGPQLLIGSIVNMLLILVALRYRSSYAIIPIIMLPSVAAVLHGVVFGPFTIFLAYMMPTIRIGNYLLVRSVQSFSHPRTGMILGSFFKAIFLFLVAYVLFSFGFLPVVFLKAMGVFQLITALIGGRVALLLARKIS